MPRFLGGLGPSFWHWLLFDSQDDRQEHPAGCAWVACLAALDYRRLPALGFRILSFILVRVAADFSGTGACRLQHLSSFGEKPSSGWLAERRRAYAGLDALCPDGKPWLRGGIAAELGDCRLCDPVRYWAGFSSDL